ncbi:MAG: tetratricopeptide repeat protein, partial [Tepidisphaeraceae bacterium]
DDALPPPAPLRRLVAEKLPLVALVALSSIATLLAQGRAGAVQENAKYALSNRLANVPVSYARYVAKTVWPANLTVFYPHPGSWPAGVVITSALFVIVVTALAILLARRSPYVLVGWLWFVGTLVPVIGIIQVGVQSIADRYTYIPGMGLAIIAAWGLGDIAGVVVARQRIASMVTAAAVAALAWGTSRQLVHWSADTLTLFSHALAVTDDNWLAHGYVGSALVERNRIDEGRSHLAEAMRINPRYPEVHYNWANLLSREGRYADAERRYEAALRLRPAFPQALSNLGVALAAQGRFEWAEARFRDAIALNPDYADAHANLGRALARQGRHAEAVPAYREALRLQPNSPQAQSGLEQSLGALRDAGNVPQ